MTSQRLLLGTLLTVLLVSLNGSGPFSAGTNGLKVLPAFARNHVPDTSERTVKLPPGISSAWWGNIQNQIRRAEYNITWQTQTYLTDLPAAYQAPNRANNLRTYFTSRKSIIIPRVWENKGSVPPWRLEIGRATLAGEKARTSADSFAADVEKNRIIFSGDDLTAWYRNDESGLEQGFTIKAPDKSPGSQRPPAALRLEMSLAGGLRPRATLNDRIIEFIGKDQRAVLRYGSLSAKDARGRELRSQVMLAGPNVALHVDTREAVFPVKVQATLTALPDTWNWRAVYPSAESEFGALVATAGDVNGDGYSDVIVGSPRYDGGLTDRGLVRVYHGSATGLRSGHAWEEIGEQENAQFGAAVATAGDVNDDRYADVLIGEPYYNGSEIDEGRVWIYLGTAGGLSNNASRIIYGRQAGARMGTSVAAAGDVNRDGYADIIVGAPYYSNGQAGEGIARVYYGSATYIDTDHYWQAESDLAGAHFGNAVSTAGDVNGDGYADVIVGAPEYTNGQLNEGGAFVWHGSSAGVHGGLSGNPGNASWKAESGQADALLGVSASTAGDVNGDGFSDVIVGIPYYSNGHNNEGACWVFHGSVGGLNAATAWGFEGGQIGAYLGTSVATAGDVNGDGYADVIVGAYSFNDDQDNEGRVWVFQGSSSGLGLAPAWFADGNQAEAWFGLSVATAGDVNGDGYSDIIIGAPRYSGSLANQGAAYVYHGSASSLDSTVVWTKPSNQANAYFGWSVATAGDVNGDGYADIIVGAYGWDAGQVNEGGAWVYLGSENGVVSAPHWYKQSDQADAWFGYSVGTAGDVNGDGYSDVIVGAPYWDHGQENEGGAWVYLGGSAGLNTVPAWYKQSDKADARFGWSVGTAGDVNGDGYADVIVGSPYYDHPEDQEGLASVYHGSAAGLESTPAWFGQGNMAGAHYSWSVATAGDVNGDGYSDIIVGSPNWDDGVLNEGRAWVYLGSASGLRSSHSWHAEGNSAGVQLGHAVATAGDVNGDGYSDVIVGAPFYNSQGRVWVFHGSPSGLNTTAAWYKSGGAGDQYGYAVGTAGDVNGDGFADVIIGAPLQTGSISDEGTARVFLGSAAGLQDTYAWRGEGGQTLCWYGNAVGTAGDVNGDGYADVLVGSKDYNGGLINEGRVQLYYGNASRGVSLQPLQSRYGSLTPIAPLGKSDDPNRFRTYGALWSPLGRGGIQPEVEIKTLGVPFNGAGTLWRGYYENIVPGSRRYMTFSHLTAGTAYHWRMRLRYDPVTTPFLPASRWFTQPWNGWNEMDFRTAGSSIFLPLLLRQ
jgi:hypothetical protein